MVSFFQKITDVLDQYQIPYMLSGSIAMGLYTVPRMTRDIDFIIHLEAKNVDLFVSSFKDGFYCDRAVIKEAIAGPVKMFNIIDHATGYKADFVVLKEDIKNLTVVNNLDWDYISKWVKQLNLRTFNLINR